MGKNGWEEPKWEKLVTQCGKKFLLKQRNWWEREQQIFFKGIKKNNNNFLLSIHLSIFFFSFPEALQETWVDATQVGCTGIWQWVERGPGFKCCGGWWVDGRCDRFGRWGQGHAHTQTPDCHRHRTQGQRCTVTLLFNKLSLSQSVWQGMHLWDLTLCDVTKGTLYFSESDAGLQFECRS